MLVPHASDMSDKHANGEKLRNCLLILVNYSLCPGWGRQNLHSRRGKPPLKDCLSLCFQLFIGLFSSCTGIGRAAPPAREGGANRLSALLIGGKMQ
jgi:hypothetical protein